MMNNYVFLKMKVKCKCNLVGYFVDKRRELKVNKTFRGRYI